MEDAKDEEKAADADASSSLSMLPPSQEKSLRGRKTNCDSADNQEFSRKQDEKYDCDTWRKDSVADTTTISRGRGRPKKYTTPPSTTDACRITSCPHCNRVVSTSQTLRSHREHKVCFGQNKSPPEFKSSMPREKRKRCKNNGMGGENNTNEKDDVPPAVGKDKISCPFCNRVFSSGLGFKYDTVCAEPKKAKMKEGKISESDYEDTSEVDQDARPAKKEKIPCLHCNKLFTSECGLKYHVDNYVCRKDEQPNAEMKDTSKAEMIWTADVTESAIVEGKRKRKTLFRYTPGGEVPLNRKRDELGSSYEAREESNDSRIHDNDESEEQSSGKSFAAGQLATQAPLSVQKKGKSAKDFGENVCQNVDSDDQEFASKYKPKNKRRKTRGKKDRRTCPVCKRVFTSPYGRDYHVSKRVCIPTNETIKIGTPLGTLEPGMEFVTKWGIARVLSDSRAKPTGEPVEGATALVKAWKSRLIKNELRRKEEYKTISTHSLARRKRLQELYERERKQQHSITAAIKNTTQKQVLKAYFGTLDLEGLNDRDFPPLANTFQSEPSPIETNSSEPYRIVECILIPDQRAIADYGVAIDENSDDAVFEMVERHLDSEHVKASLGSASPTRLFLQRRELTERYYADEHVYVCNRCGKVVKTKDGARYHAKTKKSCTRGPSKVDFLADYQKSLEAINRRADRLIAQQDAGTKVPVKKKAPAEIPKIKGAEEARTSPHNPRKKKKVRGADLYGTATQLTQEMPTVGTAREIFLAADREVNVGATATVHATAAESKDTTVRHAPQSHERLKKQEVAKKKRIWQPKKKRVLAYYPQVWRSLGFKVVPRKRNAIRVSFFGKQRSGRPSYEMQPFRAENIPTDDSDVLNKVILDMKDELAKLNESELGSYYPSVWKVLGFNRPRKVKKELVSLPPEPGSLSPKAPETEFVPAPPHFAYSEPIIIDVSVLAGEVDSGRYPSCKRHTDEQKNDESFHHNACSICKDDRGILFKCDFCKHVNHLECIRSRFIVKDPEPHDDFMCNKCIQGLLAKRRRAEKRRLGAVTKPGVCQQDDLQNPALDAQLSADQPEAGKEIEFLVAHAQNVEDILELVEDSQSRLQQLVKTANMNDLRRGMLTL